MNDFNRFGRTYGVYVQADAPFRDELHLSAVNSINWSRVMAQVVYYVTASQALAATSPSFCVPTGNCEKSARAQLAR